MFQQAAEIGHAGCRQWTRAILVDKQVFALSAG